MPKGKKIPTAGPIKNKRSKDMVPSHSGKWEKAGNFKILFPGHEKPGISFKLTKSGKKS